MQIVKAIQVSTNQILLTLANRVQEVLDYTSLDWQVDKTLLCRLQDGTAAQFAGKILTDLLQNQIKKQGYLGLKVGGLFYPLQRIVMAPAAVAKPAQQAQKAKAVKVKKSAAKMAVKKKKTPPKTKPKTKAPVKKAKAVKTKSAIKTSVKRKK